jgi:cyanophycinase
MLQLDSQQIDPIMPPSIKTAVMAIGGAEDKIHGRQILHAFFNRTGGSEARILIIPSASREPEIIGQIYRDIFTDMGAPFVEVLNISSREQGEDPQLQTYLESFTGVFLSGGDQLRLCALIAETPLMEKLRSLVHQGKLSLAGTSAGAAVLGDPMIAGGSSGEPPNRSLVDLTTGLGIIPEVIVDQHFHHRNRLGRLMSAIAAHPDKLGIGIDEDTCALFEHDGLIQVMGQGTVTIIDPRQVTYTNHSHVRTSDPLSIYNLRLHLLTHGDSYDLSKGEVRSKRLGLPSV